MQRGIAHIFLIVLLLLAIVLGIYLVQNRTNILPHAQVPTDYVPKTAFHLLLGGNYSPGDSGNSMMAPKERTLFYPGEEIRVNVAVSVDIESANTFSAVINYPKDLLEVVSIFKGKRENQGESEENQNEPRYCAQVETRACKTGGGYQNENGSDAAPAEICETFATPCDVPPGWYLEADKCRSDSDCGGKKQSCEFFTQPPINNVKVCRTKTYSCWAKCPDKVIEAAKTGSSTCNEADFPWTTIADYDIVRQVRGCAVTQVGDTLSCEKGVLSRGVHPPLREEGNNQITPFCGGSPSPIATCIPRPACLDEPNPAESCGEVFPEGGWCPPSPCTPRPACLDANPACKMPEDPNWCPPDRRVRDYFIQFWLPDTKFDNDIGRVVLSGGVSNPGIKTSPWQKAVMATIVFKAKKVGEAKLNFTDESLILRNSDAVNILTEKGEATISIEDKSAIKGDLDGDGVVGFRDFSILLSKWGSDDPKADLNKDGKVNIFDFSVMLSNWTGFKRKKIGDRCSGPSDKSCSANSTCIENCGPPVVRGGEEHPGYSCAKTGEMRICPICLAANTKISTPKGEINVTELKTGMEVYSIDSGGQKIVSKIIKTTKTQAPSTHKVVHLKLEDSRELWVSPNHPVVGGITAGELRRGDVYDDSIVTVAELVPYNSGFTYDLLPDSETGFYFANGIPMASTLK